MVEEVVWSFAQLGIENPLIQGLAIGLIRGLAGWAEHAFKDGKITWPELKRLGETIFRVIPQALFFGGAGLPPVCALGTDMFVTKLATITENGKKK